MMIFIEVNTIPHDLLTTRILLVLMAYAYKRNEKDTLKMTILANIFENRAQSDSVVKLVTSKF